MKVFITASFKHEENRQEIEQLCAIVKKSGFEDFCFIRDVENYRKVFDDPREIMERAKTEILQCDALLFDATEKSTIRAIEAGIAYCADKKLIIIMKEGTVIKDTLRSIASALITYTQIEDIENGLREINHKWAGK